MNLLICERNCPQSQARSQMRAPELTTRQTGELMTGDPLAYQMLSLVVFVEARDGARGVLEIWFEVMLKGSSKQEKLVQR